MSLFLSIGILTYNRARTLRETLDSILPQVADHPEIEVFVSDNASTDDTENMLMGYCERFPQLRYERNATNTGFDGNFVASVERALGEYLLFFSDDDLAPPQFIERLANLHEFKPEVAYVNQIPFFQNDPSKTLHPTQPVIKRLFTDPTEYFLYVGLGFISAIVLKPVEARKHIKKAVMGRGMAYIDISARCVLCTGGPYLFDGTLSILARYEENSRYDVLSFGVIPASQAYEDLLKDGLLTRADVDWFNRKSIRLFLPRCIVNNRLNAKKCVSAGDLRKIYGKYFSFYRLAYPLALIPKPVMRLIFLPLRAIMRARRIWRIKSGALGKRPPHLAPQHISRAEIPGRGTTK